ncbi:MAG: hypothetical protein ISQ46_05560 [Methylophilaceae bacterium]|nr:hypothetical protein [Methylophilaceae bacterium]
MKNRERLFDFTKERLKKLKWDGKQRFYFAKNCEALCIAVNKFSKTYYAHWSTSVVGKDGRLKSIGKKDEVSNTKAPASRRSLSDERLELQFRSPRPFTQKHYYSSSPEDDTVEVPITRSEELGEPRFKNKIEESIWRLKQKK